MSTPKLKVKIFSDGADLKSMLEMNANPLVTGLTTNPTLMRKSGVSDYRGFCKDVLKQVTQKPVSFEVFADDFKEMERQALEISTWGKNVYVKIPITNCEAQSSIDLIRSLSQRAVKLNVTAILTLDQVISTAEALKGGAPSIVSVFAGRIADTGRDPIPMMRSSVEICRRAGSQIELLWASSREALNIIQADSIDCHIITVTQDLIKKMAMFGKDLSQLSLETVRMFKQDADQAGFVL